jgi:putative alpha-1,2-mannosidase
LVPSVTGDIVQSLVNDGQQCGALPKWANNNDETGIMVGDPGSLIVANAYAFGAKKF